METTQLQQQIHFLQNQANVLKVRVFDAEELVKQQESAIQTFLNEIATVLDKKPITMQEVYDYIVSTKAPTERGESKQDVQDTQESEPEVISEEK